MVIDLDRTEIVLKQVNDALETENYSDEHWFNQASLRVIKSALENQKLAIVNKEEEILYKLRKMQNQKIELRKHEDRDYIRYGYEIALIDEIIKEIL